ncbi:unnamed protein product, partial [marine sediment metagenome]
MQLEDIRNISVIGAGIMGHGIGLTYALGGYRVVLNDTREEILSNAISHIRNDLKTFAENSVISQDMIEETLSLYLRILHDGFGNKISILHC